MSSVLTVEQREQAGSDSYNRFEYQVHWIVCHIIGKLQEDAECIVFCEFHDDMAEFSPNNQQYQFFQIKTKEDSSDWTIAEMSKKVDELKRVATEKKECLTTESGGLELIPRKYGFLRDALKQTKNGGKDDDIRLPRNIGRKELERCIKMLIQMGIVLETNNEDRS